MYILYPCTVCNSTKKARKKIVSSAHRTGQAVFSRECSFTRQPDITIPFGQTGRGRVAPSRAHNAPLARTHAESCPAASRDCMRHMHMPSAMASTHSAPVSTKGSERSMSESMPATTPDGEVTSMVIA